MAGFGGSVKLTGETEYNRALKQIKDNLTVLSSELKATTSLYDRNDKSTENLSKQNVILTKRLDEQNKKLAEAKKMLKEAETSTESNSQTVAKWQNEVNKAQAEVNKTTHEIKTNTEQIKQNETAINGANGELQDFADNADNAGKSAIKMGDLIKANVISQAVIGGFKALGNAILEVSKKFLDFVKSGVENASNLEEVQNVVDVVFGESAKTIDEFAKNASTQFGMTELSVKQFAGSMGAMLDSMGISKDKVAEMSLSLVGLAGDMASFYNLDHDEVWEKIRSGISGETEPLKALGINMSVANLEAYALSQGINKAYNEMTQAEQATLRYNYLLAQTANAQGDFARTSDGFANQQRILSMQFENLATNLGSFLLPSLNEIIKAFNDMMSGEISLEKGIGQLTQIVVNLANSIVEKLPQLLDAGVTMLNTILQGFTNALPNLLPAVNQLITSLLQFLVNSLPTIVDAGIQIVLSIIKGISNALPNLVPAVVDAVVTIATELVNNLDLIIDAGIQLIVGLGQGLINAIPQLVSRVPDIISSIINALTKALPKFLTMGVTILIELSKGMIQAIPQVVAQIPKIITGIVNGFKQGVSQMKNMGVNLLKGLWDGMTSWASTLWSNIKNLGKNIVNTFKNALGIHSPSKVLADEVGVNMGLGIEQGFTETIARAKDEMANAIPTDFDVATNINGANQNNFDFDTLVDAFTEALRNVKVVMDGDEMGEFVTKTVEKVVYN